MVGVKSVQDTACFKQSYLLEFLPMTALPIWGPGFPTALSSLSLEWIQRDLSHDPGKVLLRIMLSLNGLLRHLSNGCRTRVRPPGITAMLNLLRCGSAFTDSVKWALKESQTNSDHSLSGFLSKQVGIHSSTPETNNRVPRLKNAWRIPKISYMSITNFEVKRETQQ